MRNFLFLPSCRVLPVAADPSCVFVVERSFSLSRLCAGLCYWLIESVFGAAALPWRLVLARAHCNRTNENTPHHLPSKDTPSPSPCPSTLLSLAFCFYSRCSFCVYALPLQSITFSLPNFYLTAQFSTFPLYFAFFDSLLLLLPS